MTFISRKFRVASHIGGVRKRLAAKLIATLKKDYGLELRLEPNRLMPALGAWRTDVRMDCQRWEGFGEIKHPETGGWMNVTFDSWSTMTKCLKGLVVERERFGCFTVTAKDD